MSELGLGRHRWRFQSSSDRFEIQTAASNQEGDSLVSELLIDAEFRFALEFLQGDGVIRWTQIQKVMGDLCALARRGFGRADGHVCVQLPGIHVVDGDSKTRGDLD